MTLNLMLTSRHAVYLTGDFRLTYIGGRTEDDLLAQKIVPVVKFEWCALVAFCGVAKTTSGIDVGDWISQQVRVNDRREKISDFVGRLKTADQWLSKLRGDKRLNISTVGYKGRRPFSIMLSNYQDMDGRSLPTVLPRLKTYQLRPKKPEVRVFGDSSGVANSDREVLGNLLSQNDTAKLMDALADVNKNASMLVTTISPQCVVGRLHPTGGGEIIPYGIDHNLEYIPRFVKRSLEANGVVGFELKKNKYDKKLKPGWKGMTLKVQGTLGKNAIASELHAFRNVGKPILGAKKKDINVFWKIAEDNEPDTYTFQLKKADSS